MWTSETVHLRLSLRSDHPRAVKALIAAKKRGVDGLMHLVVIDHEVNTSGSMNHTTSGNTYNDERVDIITDRGISLKARE